MSNIINPKPRFGYNPDTKTIYDYLAGRDVPVTADYVGTDGYMWDLVRVRDLILSNQTVEQARGHVAPTPKPVLKAGPVPNPAVTPAKLLAGQGFTPIQKAALGITAALEASGLTAADKAKMQVSPARAIALKLTALQVHFLKS